MLIEKVRLHNTVNGFRFSAAEFTCVALVLCPFAVYYWVVGRWGLALIATGIIANCLPVVVLAARSLRDGEQAIGWRRLRDLDVRTRLGTDHPRLLADTFAIVACTLVPFLGAALFAAELIRNRATR